MKKVWLWVLIIGFEILMTQIRERACSIPQCTNLWRATLTMRLSMFLHCSECVLLIGPIQCSIMNSLVHDAPLNRAFEHYCIVEPFENTCLPEIVTRLAFIGIWIDTKSCKRGYWICWLCMTGYYEWHMQWSQCSGTGFKPTQEIEQSEGAT